MALVVRPAISTQTTSPPARLRPLTSRVLARAPGPRPAWLVGWALLPWVNAGANVALGTTTAVWEESRTLALLNYGALSVAIVVTLVGVERLAARLEQLPAALSRSLPRASTSSFAAVNSARGPLLAAAATAVAFGASAYVRDGLLSAAVRAATWLPLGIALWTFLWSYAALQLGLHRLGRQRLAPGAARVDPLMGLQPLGAVAFTGLWVLLASLAPVVMTGLPDVFAAVVGAAVIVAGVLAFVLSLQRVHRQMAALKRHELAVARDLYAEAFQPLAERQTLETLARQQPLLGAADALEKRAQALREWPVDERTVAWVVTVVTSVVAMGVGRAVFGALGI